MGKLNHIIYIVEISNKDNKLSNKMGKNWMNIGKTVV